MSDLFDSNEAIAAPLALAMRPKRLGDILGQEGILGENGIVSSMLKSGKLVSMVLYGPPGCGKSTLGSIIADSLDMHFYTLNATTASLSDLKEIVAKARDGLKYERKKSVLFLDEIHRFNKLQQDALLSYIESGVLTLIGASTENPYFSLNNALLSRVLICEFVALSSADIGRILDRAEAEVGLVLPKKIRDVIIKISAGDSRVALNYAELYASVHESVDEDEIELMFAKRGVAYDKVEDKYNIISAFIKSVRGSEPNSALYYLGRLLIGGEDPRYIARRLMILASEDIGLANPNALLLASDALVAAEHIGMPEVRIILAEVTIYLATSPKSNSAYKAINRVFASIEAGDLMPPPPHIKDHPTGYKYPHHYDRNFIPQEYGKNDAGFYLAGDNAHEAKGLARLQSLWGDGRYSANLGGGIEREANSTGESTQSKVHSTGGSGAGKAEGIEREVRSTNKSD